MDKMPDEIWAFSFGQSDITISNGRVVDRPQTGGWREEHKGGLLKKYISATPAREHAEELLQTARALQRRLDQHFGGHPGPNDWEEQAELIELLTIIEAEEEK